MAECERIENYPDMAGIVLASLWALQPPTADEALGFIRDLAPVSIAMHQGLGCVLIQKVGPPETFVSASKRAGIGNNLVELWEDQPYFILNVEENREKRRRILSWALTMTDPTEALELLDLDTVAIENAEEEFRTLDRELFARQAEEGDLQAGFKRMLQEMEPGTVWESG